MSPNKRRHGDVFSVAASLEPAPDQGVICGDMVRQAMEHGNIYAEIPEDLSNEVFESLIQSKAVRIERIVSKGHTSPATGWYDQEQNEWVIVLRGSASILFENESLVDLKEGGYINIPAHKKHRVISTSVTPETVWLAVHY